MKLFRNPFFYLSLVLVFIMGFQVAAIVRGASTSSWVGPTLDFPGGNPAAPLYQSSNIQQDTSGNLVSPGAAGTATVFGGGALTLQAGAALYGTESGAASFALVPRNSYNDTLLYFGSGGHLFITYAANGSRAAVISLNGTPSSTLSTGFNLDFNGSINAKSFYVNGASLTGSGQWGTNGTSIYYILGKVGIGQPAPQYALDVTGDINFTGNLRQNGAVFSSSQYFNHLAYFYENGAFGGTHNATDCTLQYGELFSVARFSPYPDYDHPISGWFGTTPTYSCREMRGEIYLLAGQLNWIFNGVDDNGTVDILDMQSNNTSLNTSAHFVYRWGGCSAGGSGSGSVTVPRNDWYYLYSLLGNCSGGSSLAFSLSGSSVDSTGTARDLDWFQSQGRLRSRADMQ